MTFWQMTQTIYVASGASGNGEYPRGIQEKRYWKPLKSVIQMMRVISNASRA